MAWLQSVTVMSTISAFKCSTIDGSSLRVANMQILTSEIEKTDSVKIQKQLKAPRCKMSVEILTETQLVPIQRADFDINVPAKKDPIMSRT